MPRIRSLKPGIWADGTLAGVTRDARLLFIALITMADDTGRFIATPEAIIGYAYPFDRLRVHVVSSWLDELDKAGLVTVYTVDQHTYGYLPGWQRHQRISHPAPSTHPPPPDWIP